MCMLLQILLPLRTRRDRPLGGFGSQRKKLTLRRCLIGGIAPMDREESIDRRALTADARSVHHLHGLIHYELSLLAHHTSYKDDVDWPARQGCVVQASGVMRASGVKCGGGMRTGNGKGKGKAFCEQQAQHDQAAGRACRATVGACDGCLETRHGEGSARTDPEAGTHIAAKLSSTNLW